MLGPDNLGALRGPPDLMDEAISRPEVLRDLRRQAKLAEAMGERGPPPRIPGFEPTPAQAIGTPEAVQAERILRNSP